MDDANIPEESLERKCERLAHQAFTAEELAVCYATELRLAKEANAALWKRYEELLENLNTGRVVLSDADAPLHETPAGPIRIRLVSRDGRLIDDLMTLELAAAKLGISRSRVSQLISDGVLDSHPLNRRCVLVFRRQVEAYARSNRKPGPKPTIG